MIKVPAPDNVNANPPLSIVFAAGAHCQRAGCYRKAVGGCQRDVDFNYICSPPNWLMTGALESDLIAPPSITYPPA